MKVQVFGKSFFLDTVKNDLFDGQCALRKGASYVWEWVLSSGERKKVFFYKTKRMFWFSFEGRTFYGSYQRWIGENAEEKQEDQNPRICAPSPGKVVRVCTKQGAQVKKGTVLLFLEAMKMEFELQAPRDGRVKRLLVEEGDLVSAEDLCVEMEFL